MGEIEVRVKTPSTVLDFVLKKKTTGQQLLTKVAGLLGLREVRFFGLQFVDYNGTSTWLGPSEALYNQRVRKESPLHFHLLVRFWPRDVWHQVAEETALVLFFRQLQAAVDSGALCCPYSTAARLAALAEQIKYGDFVDSQQQRCRGTVLPPGTAGSEGNRLGLSSEALAAWKLKVACLHRNIRGLSLSEALREYLKLAQELPTYGVSYFEATDRLGNDLWLGVTARGINLYEDKLTPKISFSWSSMHTVAYSGYKFTIKQSSDQRVRKHVFYTSQKQACMDIWMLATGYLALRSRQRRSKVSSTSHTNQEALAPRTDHPTQEIAERSESGVSRQTSDDATSASIRLPTSSGDGAGDGVLVTTSETIMSEGSIGSAAGLTATSDIPGVGNEEEDISRGSSEAAFRGSDESDARDSTGAGAQSSNADSLLRANDIEAGMEAESSDEDSDSGAMRFNLSSDESSASETIGTDKGSRRDRFKRGLSMSFTEAWGPFSESLMAPD